MHLPGSSYFHLEFQGFMEGGSLFPGFFFPIHNVFPRCSQ